MRTPVTVIRMQNSERCLKYSGDYLTLHLRKRHHVSREMMPRRKREGLAIDYLLLIFTGKWYEATGALRTQDCRV